MTLAGDELLAIAGTVARSRRLRYSQDLDELRAEVAARLVEAAPTTRAQAVDVGQWVAREWIRAARARSAVERLTDEL